MFHHPTLEHPLVLLLALAAACSSENPAPTPGSTGTSATSAGVTSSGATSTGTGTGATTATATTGVTSATSTSGTQGSVSSTLTGTSATTSLTSVGGGTSTTTATASTGTTSATSAGGSSSTGGGNVGPAPESIVVQDNFDSAVAGMPPSATLWEPYPQGQESLGPTIDGTKAKSGSNSARVTSTNSGLGSFLVPAAGGPLGGAPLTGNTFYVRVHMNWQKATTEISGHSAYIVGSVGRDNSGTEARLGLSSKGPNSVPRVDFNLIGATDGAGGEVTRYSNGFTDGGNPADFPETGLQFAADTWYCVEAYFNGAAGASEFRLWVDSTEITQMHVTDFSANASGRTSWAPTYQYIKIGAQDYDANLGQIWYDEVVVATEPIGCSYVVP